MKVTDEKGRELNVPDGIWEATVKEYAVKKPWPQNDNDYWRIDAEGEVGDSNWDGYGVDRDRLAYGNIYRTREEAEKVVAKRKAEAAIRRYIAENGLEFTPDWSDQIQSKFYVYWSGCGWDSSWQNTDNECHPFYFASKDHAQQVIDNCREHLEVLFDA